ncbi:MAG: hypothetical protein JSW34_10990 [Candidatus Zixiibacteriota bacterium]|nr:MAG: hypothetical protein JSW34_10990 [candidate division Zixibacteria bacterium]
MIEKIPSPISLIYTNIGRGHPFYLDGIAEVLRRRGQLGLVRRQTDVFELSHGFSLLAWKALRTLYRVGTSDGLGRKFYNRIRSGVDYDRGGLAQKIMGRGIRRTLGDTARAVLVAHPILVAILKDCCRVIYQHGESAVPRESIVSGAEFVLVPTERAASSFIGGGYAPGSVIVTGLCIEPALVRNAEECFERRLSRLNGQQPLTGAFFSSGAEPASHVEKLAAAAWQAVASGGRALVFARSGGDLARRAAATFKRTLTDFVTADASQRMPADLPAAIIVTFRSRREANAATAAFFAQFDYFVAPSHERSNWALGLGLPMFITGPSYSPFSILNREILIKAGVTREIESPETASRFGALLKDLRQHGALSDMSHAGWKVYDIDGFEKIADFLANHFCRNAL